MGVNHKTRDFVDLYKLGRWNHSLHANNIDWIEYAASAINLLKDYGNEYHIKKDLGAIL